ncbi:lactate dehydrogenase-like 2-hydroxyacid dehydrogenase [Sphingobium sp. B11D3B]|uniref:2-hydroxyacid dehydrogenase n=1 Tax=Sphingobium sp. B11D3B TaxID=2940575 RepID=UPI002226E9C1|nr:2-hydroxyacid dehydrogenase [Sphingobium sp. B11D3B]MCW2390014.1 lactate dehydrogenase-like 2-hydroxyacid dehydrogenase [Sphingobium sp. B11D3B]
MNDLPEIAVIAELPADLRTALERDFRLIPVPLEGANSQPVTAIPSTVRAVATRAVLGIPSGLLEALPDLGLVLSLGAGLDNIDVEALAARQIVLAHTPDQFTEDVADFALGLIYAAERNIVAADRFMRSGRWAENRFMNGRRVSARRVGIVGLGRIGRRLAEKCASLGMSVDYHARAPVADCAYTYHSDVTALAAACDILVLACAVTDQTRRMVTREVLDALGPQGIVVNIARGAVIDEEALIDALQDRTIAGAALDVFDKEPDFDPRLARLENVILTPHAASFTFEARQAVIDHLMDAARTYFSSVEASHAPT